MKTTQTVCHLYARSLAIAVATACVTVVAHGAATCSTTRVIARRSRDFSIIREIWVLT
jgi:hypothetical protein